MDKIILNIDKSIFRKEFLKDTIKFTKSLVYYFKDKNYSILKTFQLSDLDTIGKPQYIYYRILKKDNDIDRKEITEKEFNELLKNNKISFTYKVISYIKDTNLLNEVNVDISKCDHRDAKGKKINNLNLFILIPAEDTKSIKDLEDIYKIIEDNEITYEEEPKGTLISDIIKRRVKC